MDAAATKRRPDRQSYPDRDLEKDDNPNRHRHDHHYHIHLGTSPALLNNASKSGTVLYSYDQSVYAAPSITGCLKCWIGCILCPLAVLCFLLFLLLVGVKWVCVFAPSLCGD